MCAESALIEAVTRMSGWFSPSSAMSSVALTAPISWIPARLWSEIIPGHTSWPETSKTTEPSGMSTPAPMATIVSPCISSVPRGMSGPVIGCSVPPISAV